MSRYYRAIPHGENGKPDYEAPVGPVFEARHPDAVHRHLNRKLWTIVPASRTDLIASKGKVEKVEDATGGRPAQAAAKKSTHKKARSASLISGEPSNLSNVKLPPPKGESTVGTSTVRSRRSTATQEPAQPAQDADSGKGAATTPAAPLRSFNRGSAAASVATDKPADPAPGGRPVGRNRYANAGGSPEPVAKDPAPAAPARRGARAGYRPPSAEDQSGAD